MSTDARGAEGPLRPAAVAAGATARRRSAVRPGWPVTTSLGMVVLGGALVNLALVRGLDGRPVLAAPLLVGLAEAAWALGALRSRSLPAARVAGPALVVAGAGWLLVAAWSQGTIGTADAAAAVLQVAAGFAVTVVARLADTRPRPEARAAPRRPEPARRTLGRLGVLFVTAVAVSAVAGAGMAAAPAGSDAHMPGMPAMHHGAPHPMPGMPDGG